MTRLSEDDLYLFNEGSHFRLYRHLGAHPDASGVEFAVWAPNARRVSVVGDWNGWSPDAQPLEPAGRSGLWRGRFEGVPRGAAYKYHVVSAADGSAGDRADPFASFTECPPRTASRVWTLEYDWGDDAWMAARKERSDLSAPVSIYEVHLGSWRRDPARPHRHLTYREIAPLLRDHVVEMGFTHVELLPVCEHPFYGSWGYQGLSYFAPTARYGTPQDLMFLVDTLHQAGIGVILDWVPSHFPGDAHGLYRFDGTHLYEHADPRRGFHPDWQSYIFNYGRHEVRSFLISSALFWLDVYHFDALRVDAVASMLYLDYSRGPGEWIPNEHGGRENLEAIAFLRRLNQEVYKHYPDAQTIAEESTAWPGVSRPTDGGGLGFGYKWDMGWMHDTLGYLAREPVHRRYHHNDITFRAMYAFHENFVLPLSHDEVVHGKGSLLGKMPGDDWQRRANLRLLYAYQFAQPGKKLLFMGAELGQMREWDHDSSLDWHLLHDEGHRGIARFVAALNALYREQPALHEKDTDPGGFQWIDGSDAAQSVLSFLRTTDGAAPVLAVFNFTPVVREGYRVGVPRGGTWHPLLCSDDTGFGGSGVCPAGPVTAEAVPCHGRDHSLSLTLPPLGALFLQAR